jgi:DNA-binding transcriptional regulator GbsR (MarR family)
MHDTMRLQETEVAMAQVHGHRRHVYINFMDYNGMQETLISTNGHEEIRYTNGVISKVRMEAAGLRIRRFLQTFQTEKYGCD